MNHIKKESLERRHINMSLRDLPPGRVVFYPPESGEVNDLDRNDYILINRDVIRADEPREYRINGITIQINLCNDVIKKLSKHNF